MITRRLPAQPVLYNLFRDSREAGKHSQSVLFYYMYGKGDLVYDDAIFYNHWRAKKFALQLSSVNKSVTTEEQTSLASSAD